MRTPSLPLLLLSVATLVPAQAPPQRLFDWTDVPFPASEYGERRAALTKKIAEAGGGVLLVPSRDILTQGSTFRQLDDFNYLTGLELPESMLLIDADRERTTLFIPTRDRRFRNPSRRNDFPGRRLLADPLISGRSGIEDTRDVKRLPDVIARIAKAGRTVHVGLPAGIRPDDVAPRLIGRVHPTSTTVLRLKKDHPELAIRNARPHLAAVRMIKSPRELEVLRRAADITSRGIRAAAARVAPGMDERGLAGIFESTCKLHGAQRLAFDSIVKSGPNAMWPWRILASHYDRRNRHMKDGEIVILDVGCELDHYASDVGRTFPVGGQFTDRQRELVDMVRRVSDAVIAAVRPGSTFAQLRRVANDAIPEAERRHMQAGLFYGHHVGLAVGDPAHAQAPLAPGMTFTVEPWYYNHDEGIAVFIEDMVAVTADGCENLTAALPRTPAALEAMTRGARPRRQVRVLAYNIRHGEGVDRVLDLPRIAEVIKAARPDVVALQEIDEGVRRTGGVDQMAELAKLTGMKPAFGPFFDYQGGRYGMGLLSKHPMTEVRNVRLPDGDEPRTALAATITVDGRSFVICGIHLYRTKEERVAQARALLSAFEKEARPIVLTGDFNSPAQGAVMDALAVRFSRVPKTSRPRATFPAPLPVTHIDHTLIPRVGPLRAVRCDVLDEKVASDHRPILTILEWVR